LFHALEGTLREFIEQLRNIWNKMDNTRRWILIISVAVVLVSIILISWLSNRPKYELLYSKLDEESKAQIIVKLNEMKIAYKETASGGIAVPNATNVRASLLQQGIPNGGSIGFEIFDKSTFSDTDFTNSIKKQRAITGELERTLRKIGGIEGAKVILNMPESNEYIFADDKPEGTASVQLTLREPGILSQDQVSSILNMVKGATGLKTENITVVDNFANDLTAALKPSRDGKFGSGRNIGNLDATADRFFYTTQYNKQMSREIESLLARVFSFKKVKAVVNAELDFDYQETQSETFAPKGTVRSEQHKSETYEGTGANSVGIPGTDSNITQYKAPDAGTSNYKGDKSEDTLNYEISNVKQFTVNSPGKVKRQSVSVLVYAKLDEDIKRSVYQLARNAAGIMDERGDTISVETFVLPTTAPKNRGEKLPWTTIIIASILGVLLITLIVLVIIKEPVPQQIETVKTIKLEPEPPPPPIVIREKISGGSVESGDGGTGKRKDRHQKQPYQQPGMEVEEEMPIPIVGTKIDKIIEDRAQREQTGAAAEVFISEPELSPEEILRQERLKAIEKLALEKPAEVAVLLRAWLSEE
jgi:flagellar M-ring protein FliF